jgi:DNA-binding transcriptional regulator YdaS (Cro superfamily)
MGQLHSLAACVALESDMTHISGFVLREFLRLVGSRSKLVKLLGIDRTYLGRVLSGEKSITAGVVARIRALQL